MSGVTQDSRSYEEVSNNRLSMDQELRSAVQLAHRINQDVIEMEQGREPSRKMYGAVDQTDSEEFETEDVTKDVEESMTQVPDTAKVIPNYKQMAINVYNKVLSEWVPDIKRYAILFVIVVVVLFTPRVVHWSDSINNFLFESGASYTPSTGLLMLQSCLVVVMYNLTK
jgi:hypothetical protein